MGYAEGRTEGTTYISSSGSPQNITSSLLTEDTEWYAQWVRSHKVEFDRNGGSGGTGSLDIATGASIGAITKPTLAGWTFSGYTDDFGTASYLFVNSSGNGTSRTITSDRTLKANWTRTVALNANGGTSGSLTSLTAGIGRPLGQKCSQVAMADADYPIRSLFKDGITDKSDWAPTSDGYSFGGYYNSKWSSGGNRFIDADGAATTAQGNVAADWPVIMYARWVPNTINLTWDSQGGSVVGDTYADYNPGTKVPLPSSTPEKDGYVFIGWYTESLGGARVDESTALPVEDTTFYAHWSAAISADVPVDATVRVDLLGIEDQAMEPGKEGYIESRSGAPLKVESVAFTREAGAEQLFGSSFGQVSLQALAGDDASWATGTPAFSFALDAAGADAVEDDEARLAPFAMAGYEARIPISYRFAIPSDVLAAIDPARFEQVTTSVCSVVYTVALQNPPQGPSA